MIVRHLARTALLTGALGLSPVAWSQETLSGDAPGLSRPNILLVVVDDAAFMDFGAFGGEARTPTIDALAGRGAMLTRYRSSPLCAPSRAMLLTGMDSHRTGVSTIAEVLPSEHRGRPGYTLSLEPGVETLADRLHAAGYRTYMTGKWHLGHGEGELPVDHGFDRSFILDASGADNWEDRPYMPYYERADWFEDGARASLPEDFYSSRFLVDRMITYLDEAPASDQPFFAYLAFQAIHIPVQAPREFTDGYADTYAAGWDALRTDRAARARALGLIPGDAALSPMAEGLRPWSGLTADEQALYARAMAVNAGMLEAMDHHLGRLLDHLDATGALDNTIVIVTSDNGPEPSHPVGEPGFTTWMALHSYDWQLETLGERGSMNFIGPEWAMAAASPFDLFKFYATDGGLRVPFVAAGPGIATGVRSDAEAFVTDVTPTLLDLAGLDRPDTMDGISLRPVLDGSGAQPSRTHVLAVEVSGNAALFDGDYKLVHNGPPFGDGQWRLFNLADDPGETTDLSGELPERLAAMQAAYADYAGRNGVLAVPEGYDIHGQLAINVTAASLGRYGRMALAGLLVLLAGIGGVIWWRRRR